MKKKGETKGEVGREFAWKKFIFREIFISLAFRKWNRNGEKKTREKENY